MTENSGWLIVSIDTGVKIGCTIDIPFHVPRHLCAIQVSGFYHGKVRGVLGKYDNELQYENMIPTGTVQY